MLATLAMMTIPTAGWAGIIGIIIARENRP